MLPSLLTGLEPRPGVYLTAGSAMRTWCLQYGLFGNDFELYAVMEWVCVKLCSMIH